MITEELIKILEEYRATPIDQVNQRKLREWGVVLSSELIYLGQEVIKAEHNYWREIGKARGAEGIK